MTQRPKPLGGFPGRAMGHPGFPQMPVSRSETALDVAWGQLREGIEEPGPDRARRPVLRHVFIGNSRQAGIAARPLRHPPIARTGLTCLAASATASLTASLAGVSRHPDSPALTPYSQCRSGVLKSRVKGNSSVRSSLGGSILPGVWP